MMGKLQEVHLAAFIRFQFNLAASLTPLYEYLCMCILKKNPKQNGKGINTLLHSVFVCVGNTSNGRLMIGLIDTQQ